jgi:hypothetical protein
MKVFINCILILVIYCYQVTAQEKSIDFPSGNLEIVLSTSTKIEGYDGNKIVIEPKGEKGLRRGITSLSFSNDSLFNYTLSNSAYHKKNARGLKPIGSQRASQNQNPYILLKEKRNDKSPEKVYLTIRNINGSLILKEEKLDKPPANSILAGTTYTIKIPNKLKLKVKSANTEKNNQDWSSIWVPRLTISKFKGGVEIDIDGRIELSDVTGSVLANSLKGNIKVEFDKVMPVKLYSLITNDGFITIDIPKTASVDMKIKAFEIYSNLDFKISEEKALRGTKQMKLILNQGDTKFNIDAGYGNVYLKRN